jgi:hypothetical protein
MDDLLGELDAVAATADTEAETLRDRIRSTWKRLEPGVQDAARAWSESRIGYHANVYIKGMEPKRPGEVWDALHGPPDGGLLNRTSGQRWCEWDPESVFDWLLERAGLAKEDLARVNVATDAARVEVRSLRDRARPLVDALSARFPEDAGLGQAKDAIAALKGETNDSAALKSRLGGHYQSSDTLAITQGPRLPVHEGVQMQFETRLALAGEFETLARECRYVRDYLRTKVRVATALDKAAPAETSAPSAPARCRVLLLAANPDEDLALNEELRAVQEGVRASEHRERVELIPRMASRPGDLLRAMIDLRPSIVHFSGHGDSQTAIYLQDEAGGAHPVTGEALRMLFDAARGEVRVVVLASCYSAAQGEAIAKSVDCVIGMEHDFGDLSARAFAGAFYSALGAGRSVAEAFELGRASIAVEGLGDEGIPVLLVRDGVDAGDVVLVPPPKSG